MRRAKHDARTCFQPFTHNTPRTEAPTLSKTKLKGSARCNHTHAPSESQSTRLQRNANKLSSSSLKPAHGQDFTENHQRSRRH